MKSGFVNQADLSRYDAYYNRLESAKDLETGERTTYEYYVDGLRKSKDGTYYIWLDGNAVYEFTSSGGKKYTYGHRLLYSDDVKYVLNAHGDVVALLNASGAVTKRYEYDAFGNELTLTSNDVNPFRYCAEYLDLETGQVYLRNRYYQPVTGRFTQLDPIRDGLNWYAYCGNNPIKYIDFWGLIAYETVYTLNSKQYNCFNKGLNNSLTSNESYQKFLKSFSAGFLAESGIDALKDKMTEATYGNVIPALSLILSYFKADDERRKNNETRDLLNMFSKIDSYAMSDNYKVYFLDVFGGELYIKIEIYTKYGNLIDTFVDTVTFQDNYNMFQDLVKEYGAYFSNGEIDAKGYNDEN